VTKEKNYKIWWKDRDIRGSPVRTFRLLGSPTRSLQSAKAKVVTQAHVQSPWRSRYPRWRVRVIEQGQDASTDRSPKDAFPSVGGSVKAGRKGSRRHGADA